MNWRLLQLFLVVLSVVDYSNGIVIQQDGPEFLASVRECNLVVFQDTMNHIQTHVDTTAIMQALQVAAASGCIEIVSRIIVDFNVNICSDEGLTAAVFLAAIFNHLPIVVKIANHCPDMANDSLPEIINIDVCNQIRLLPESETVITDDCRPIGNFLFDDEHLDTTDNETDETVDTVAMTSDDELSDASESTQGDGVDDGSAAYPQIPNIWRYTVVNGTKQQQAEAFIEELERKLANRDSKLAGRLIVRSVESVGRDGGALSATLFQSVITVIIERLSSMQQVFSGSYFNIDTVSGGDQTVRSRSDRIFLPISTIATPEQRRYFALLGAIIRMVFNQNQILSTKITLAVPIPLAFFKRLLFSQVDLSDDDIRETAFWSEYSRWYGDSDCSEDIMDMFPDVGLEEQRLSKMLFLHELVSRLLINVPGSAMRAASAGFFSVSSDKVADAVYLRDTVVSEPRITYDLLMKQLSFDSECVPNGDVIISEILKEFSDDDRANFVEVATGGRGLHPVPNSESMITISICWLGLGIEAFACERKIFIASELLQDRELLKQQLLDYSKHISSHGIGMKTFNRY